MLEAMSYLAQLVDFILPPRCIVTGDIVDKQGMISPQAWSNLRFISMPQCACCGIPFDFEFEGDNLEIGASCAACLKDKPVYHKARAALVYDDASRALILPFKHGDKTHFALGFIPWLKQAGAALIDQADIIMPVPLHRFRLLQRRFNQAGIMAHYLAKACDKPCLLGGIERIRATPTQGHLRVKERQKNVRRAFAIPPKYREGIKGKAILLVDDVFTTGATVNECTKALLGAGAMRVDVLTLTRVVKPVHI
jgi:ComF family protein